MPIALYGTSQTAEGTNPTTGLIQGLDGDLYGTTPGGGTFFFSTVYSVSVGLAPFVKTMPASGHVGAAVKILGTNLSSAASISFNGTPAVFTVVTPSEITTTVPTGASSGKIQVTLLLLTLSSNAPFRVLP